MRRKQADYTKKEVENMFPSERVAEGDKLWENGYPLPHSPEAEPEEQDFEEKVGVRMLELLERLEKISKDKHDEYLRDQRQVAHERVEADMIARSDTRALKTREVEDALYKDADYVAALQLSAGRVSDVSSDVPTDLKTSV